MDVIHTAIQVSDLEATLAFYEGVLGLEHEWEFTTDEGVRNSYVGTEAGGTIQFKYDPEGVESIEPSGVDHLALSVEDVDATFERVCEEAGWDVHLEPTTFEAAERRAAFVSDPDGSVVEFVRPV